MPLPDLLAATETVNACQFFHRRLEPRARQCLTRVLTASFAWRARGFRTGGPAPDHVRTFTGEKVSGAPKYGVLNFEATRALRLLKPSDALARDTASAAADFCLCRVLVYQRKARPGRKTGLYCCPPCSCAFWRLLVTGQLHRIPAEQFEREALQSLKLYRCDGGWRGFPFHYALLSLVEFRTPEVVEELRYAAPRLEGLLKEPAAETTYAARRRILAERVLSRA